MLSEDSGWTTDLSKYFSCEATLWLLFESPCWKALYPKALAFLPASPLLEVGALSGMARLMNHFKERD